MTGEELHSHLDEIERIHGLYSPAALGFAAALACSCFTFLLGGGIVEMLCAFCGAGIGNFVRCKLTKHHFTLFLGITASVCSASVVYAVLLKAAEVLFAVSAQHEAGYICSMLFIIPGFPFITSGIDLAKLDMRSGLERLAYAILIILVATLTAWIMAMLLHLQPVQFPPLSLTIPEEIVLRLLASFGGVFGFSLMFNSPRNLAVCAALIGAVTNTFRLELVSLAGFPPAVAAFLGALLSGLLATCLKKCSRIPAHLCYRPVHRHHGSGTVLLPCHLQFGHYVPDRFRHMVRGRHPHHRSAAAGADLRPYHHRPYIPVLHLMCVFISLSFLFQAKRREPFPAPCVLLLVYL